MAPLPLARLAYFAFLGLLAWIQNAAGDKAQTAADQAQILNCVKTVANQERMSIGVIDIDGSNRAFPVLKDNLYLAAGGRIGKGRVFGAGQACIFNGSSGGTSDRDKFIDNLLHWLSKGNMDEIAVLPQWNYCDFKFLRDRFKKVTVLKGHSQIDTTNASVILIEGQFFREYEKNLIKRAFHDGKGILILAGNWLYVGKYVDADHFRTQWGPNVIAREAGFTFRWNRSPNNYDLYGTRSKAPTLYSVAPSYKCVKG